MTRDRFQAGSLVKVETGDGHSWVVRYNKDGRRKALTIGNHITLPTLDAAKRKMSDLAPTLNDNSPVFTFGQLVERYKLEELPSRPQTAASYLSLIKHLEAKWGAVELRYMLKDLMAIQGWLKDLKTMPTKDRMIGKTLAKGKPARVASKKTKQNLKAMLHRIVECGMRWGYLPIDRNPIGLVEIKVSGAQPKKRLKKPLNIAQVQQLSTDPEMSEHVRVMVKLSVGLGLRISEVLGLRWEDIDFERQVVSIMRGAVGSHIDQTKSAESCAELPLHPYLVQTLKDWQEYTPSVKGWVFGNITTGRPFHRDSLQADHLLPAGRRCGIDGLGWHTFRHTHINLLRQSKVASEVQMMLMRHADMRTTNAYGRDDGSLELKRPANQAVIEAIVGKGE